MAISKPEVRRRLTDQRDRFLNDARNVVRAELETSSWVSVDDTGARHKAVNNYCTQIGNDRFTWFGPRSSKSRLNFLDRLRAGHADFVLNKVAFDYVRSRARSAPLITRLAEQPGTSFIDQKACSAHLDRFGLTALTTALDPVQIATEGAIRGQHPRPRFSARWSGAER